MSVNSLLSNRTRLAAIGLLLVLAFGYLVYVRLSGGQHMGEFPPAAVETVRAQEDAVEVKVAALGTLQADQSITIAPEIQGIVTSIDFTDGQRLEKDGLIITLDSGSLKARLMQAQARVTLTRANFERAERLRKQGSGTERARDEALNDMKSAEADAAAAQADLDKAMIRAPFGGIIGLRQVSLGQFLRPGDPIATLADVDNLRIDFRVSEVFLTRIEKGQEVSVRLDALPGETFKGIISAVDPVVDINGRAISVRALLANESGKLRPGLFGRVDIVTQTRKSVVVPEAAIVPQQTGAKAVFVVSDKNIAELRPVEIGERQPGKVEILSGVKPGEIVVTAGQLKLREGAPVMPVAPEETGGAPASAPKV
jgi:membrane fusion protein (multidrug efflux system)